MTARAYYDPEAGPWVAYREVPRTNRKTGEVERRKDYPWSARSVWPSYIGTPEEALRFDTKKEALEFIKGWHPVRRRGIRLGAERCPAEDGQPPTKG